MSAEHNIITSLRVVARDGTEKPGTIGSRIKLSGGPGFSVKKDSAEERSFVIAADGSAGADDPYYRQKYYDIVNGCGTGSLPPCADPSYGPFSGTGTNGYYISTINNKAPFQADGALALVGSACGQVGEFPIVEEDESSASSDDSPIGSVVVESTPNQMSIFDMCPADVDCEDYQRLSEKIARISSWLDANKDKNLTSDSQLFKQYQATVQDWNYLANMQGIIFKVYASDQYVRVISGYRMLGCTGVSGVFWNIVPEVQEGQEVMIVPKVTGVNVSKVAFRPVYTTTTGDNLVVTVSGPPDMTRKDFVIVSSIFSVHLLDSSSFVDDSSSSSENLIPNYNNLKFTATFYNTHLQVPVTIIKSVETRYV